MGKKLTARRIWPDVARLLQKRREFRDIRDPNVASSVTAFLAWKAFLIVVRGSATGDEKDQCREVVTRALVEFPILWENAEHFVKSLRPLQSQSANVVGDWYAEPSWTEAQTKGRVAWATRSIGRLHEAMTRKDHRETFAGEIAEHAYAIRSAVLAHGAVHSTGNLFQLIVPRFEDFVARVACAGYAHRAQLPLKEAYEECNVGIITET